MTSVVVYPYVVPDVEWLKTAALLWDKVHRIDSAFAPGDPAYVRELDSAVGGFLVSEEVSHLGVRAYHAFEAWLI